MHRHYGGTCYNHMWRWCHACMEERCINCGAAKPRHNHPHPWMPPWWDTRRLGPRPDRFEPRIIHRLDDVVRS